MIREEEKKLRKHAVEAAEKRGERKVNKKAREIAKSLLDVFDVETIAVKAGLTVKLHRKVGKLSLMLQRS